MIDDVKAELPVEIKRAKDLVANRNDYMANTKREAEMVRQKAEDYARELLDKHAITREAEKRAEEIISQAEEECRSLKDMASDYCEDTLRRMEEAVADTYDEVKHTCAKFRSALGASSGGSPAASPPAGPCTTLRPTRIDATTRKRPLVGERSLFAKWNFWGGNKFCMRRCSVQSHGFLEERIASRNRITVPPLLQGR